MSDPVRKAFNDLTSMLDPSVPQQDCIWHALKEVARESRREAEAERDEAREANVMACCAETKTRLTKERDEARAQLAALRQKLPIDDDADDAVGRLLAQKSKAATWEHDARVRRERDEARAQLAALREAAERVISANGRLSGNVMYAVMDLREVLRAPAEGEK